MNDENIQSKLQSSDKPDSSALLIGLMIVLGAAFVLNLDDPIVIIGSIIAALALFALQ